ncbi:hypothetical protein [Chitinophaga vietnamensis]|uniref:hypothetical protein n=1 Tax=Chitinophaga vietnamensis TaxID=2593957 RepID=UPI0011788CE4|nr:hypothetical protein [Chitinophaga vietnamensis]
MKKNLFLFLGCLLVACKNEEAPKPSSGAVDCSTAKITTAYAYAVVQANCTNRGCHPGGNSPSVADFSTSDKLKAYINGKRAIFESMVTGPQADMPQSQGFPALSQGMKDSLACWIGHGMPDQ